MNRVAKPTLVAIGAAVLAVAILAGGYFALVAPKRAKITDLERSASATQTQLAAALARSHSAAGRAERVQVADLFRLAKAMPDTVDSAGMLFDLGRLARRNKVQIVDVEQQTPSAAANGYESVPVDVYVQGRYAQVTSFLDGLRRLVYVRGGALHADGRLFRVDSVQFAAGADGFPQVKATLDLEAYVFVPASSAPTSTTPGSSQPAPAASGSVSAAGSGTGGGS